MGLTIHWELNFDGSHEKVMAQLVQLRNKALDLPFENVDKMLYLQGAACDFHKSKKDDPHGWLLCQADAHVEISNHCTITVPPTKIIAFETWPGEGCEQANFGLCRFPSSIKHEGRTIKTKLSGWRWQSFCKTQYANEFGTAHFLKCHLSVIALLDEAKKLGLLKEVFDEGEFWEKRDVGALIKEIGEWDEMIAGFAGVIEASLGGVIQAPIKNRADFEHLEAKGLEKVSKMSLNEMLRLLKILAEKGKKHESRSTGD